jgi:hypothetical protein
MGSTWKHQHLGLGGFTITFQTLTPGIWKDIKSVEKIQARDEAF